MGGGFYNCRSVTRHAKQKGTWHSTPKKGALVVFRNGAHIGSITKYDDIYIYTNEGNTSSTPGVVANGGSCRNKKYKRTDPAIDGYVWIVALPPTRDPQKQQSILTRLQSGWEW